PTATSTATPTATSTSTPTPSPTATSTATPSPTATFTPIPTSTSTPTPTATSTPTPTPTPVNHAPVVNAGPDQIIDWPANTVTLSGTVTDDGQPAGATVTSSWSQLSGPGTTTFADAASPSTSASFSAPGV